MRSGMNRMNIMNSLALCLWAASSRMLPSTTGRNRPLADNRIHFCITAGTGRVLSVQLRVAIFSQAVAAAWFGRRPPRLAESARPPYLSLIHI